MTERITGRGVGSKISRAINVFSIQDESFVHRHRAIESMRRSARMSPAADPTLIGTTFACLKSYDRSPNTFVSKRCRLWISPLSSGLSALAKTDTLQQLLLRIIDMAKAPLEEISKGGSVSKRKCLATGHQISSTQKLCQ